MTYKEQLSEKYSAEIEVLNKVEKGFAYSLDDLDLSEYAVRSVYANNLVKGLAIEQIGGIIFTITIYNNN